MDNRGVDRQMNVERVLILGIDALEYDLVEERDLKYLKHAPDHDTD